MKEIIIKTQAEMDAVKADFDGIVKIIGIGIRVKIAYRYRVVAWDNSSVEAWGNSSVVATGNSSVVARGNSSVVARDNSSVVAWDNSSVEAWGNSSVVAWDNSSVVARGNSSVVARDNSSVVAWDNSSVEAWDNSSVEAWGNSSVVATGNSSVVARDNSSVVARGNSSVVAWDNSSVVATDNSSVEAWGNSSVDAWGNSSVVATDNSSVEAWGNSSVVAWGNSSVRLFNKIKSLSCFGFSVVIKPFDLKFTFEKTKDVLVQKFKPLPYLEREGIEVKKGNVILFKKVSKDFKTQKGTKNETRWAVGSTVTHPAWNPKQDECGEGKFHAVSRPYFGSDFRSEKDDRYVAIQIAVKDLYEWPNAGYPHKIAFREGRVLYECDKFGKEKKT